MVRLESIFTGSSPHPSPQYIATMVSGQRTFQSHDLALFRHFIVRCIELGWKLSASPFSASGTIGAHVERLMMTETWFFTSDNPDTQLPASFNLPAQQ